MALLVLLCSVAAAKPKIAILGLEVIGSLDPEQVKLARQLTNGLRERASAGTGPFELAPSSDKELVDEKLMNNCDTEALACMAPIGLAFISTGTACMPSPSGTVTSVKLTLVSALTVQRTGALCVPGTTWRQPFSISQSSNANQAAIQVPGCTRR
jgi:hypothetical protein